MWKVRSVNSHLVAASHHPLRNELCYQDHLRARPPTVCGLLSKYPTGALLRIPSSANSAPCGSAQRITQLPPTVSSGPSNTCPPPDVTRCTAAAMSWVLK